VDIRPQPRTECLHQFDTESEAKKKRDEFVVKLHNGTLPSAQRHLVSALMNRHLEECQRTTKVLTTEWRFEHFIKTFGKRDISDLKKKDLRAWLEQLQKEHGLSAKTANKTKSHLSHFTLWAVEEGFIRENPFEGVWFSESAKNAPRRKPRIVFSPEQLAEITEQAKIFDKTHLYPFLYALVHLGSRAGETLKLLWDDIELDRGVVSFRAENTKTGEARRVQMSSYLRDFLKDMHRRGDYVFPNEKGKLMGYSTIHGALKRFRKVCPMMRDAGFHSLRHSYATNCLLNRMPVHAVQKVLGLSSYPTQNLHDFL
jgi:integrase